MPLEYSYDESQVRKFAEAAQPQHELDEMITKLDVWASRKLRELDRSDQ